MVDRDKVIKGLECCRVTIGMMCDECPYKTYYEPLDAGDSCAEELYSDVLELLTAKKPIMKSDMYFCGECKNALAETWAFCPKCGKAVKWDERK